MNNDLPRMDTDERRWPPRGMRLGGLFQWPTGNAFSVVGVDIGQRQDHTAIAVVEERRVKTGWDAAHWRDTFEIQTSVRYLERLPLGTSFTSMVSRIKALTDSLKDEPPAAVVVDATGMGAPVVEMLKLAELRCQVTPVTITGGDQVTAENGWWRVPKRDLVANLQVMLEERRLKVAGGIPEAATLVREMQEMRVKIGTSGREQYAAWREGQHDDLVLAVGLAAWWLKLKRWGDQRVGEQSRRLV